MKKKTKQLFVLACVMLCLLAAYLILPSLLEREDKEEEVGQEILDVTEFATEDIASYRYKNEAYEIGFLVTEDGCVNTEDAAFPVNLTTTAGQLVELGTMTYLQIVDNTNKEDFNLANPPITMSVTLKDGSERNFAIGDPAPFDDAYYLLDVEKDIIYLVETDVYSEFATTWTTLVEREEIVSVAADQMIDVTVESDEFEPITVTYDETQEYPWQLEAQTGRYAGNAEAVLEKLGIYSSYIFRYVYEYDVQDLSKYGLTEPSTTVTVRYYEKDANGALTDEVNTLVLEFGSQNVEDDIYYARMNGSSYVYGMSTSYTQKVAQYVVEELKMTSETAAE